MQIAYWSLIKSKYSTALSLSNAFELVYLVEPVAQPSAQEVGVRQEHGVEEGLAAGPVAAGGGRPLRQAGVGAVPPYHQMVDHHLVVDEQAQHQARYEKDVSPVKTHSSPSVVFGNLLRAHNMTVWGKKRRLVQFDSAKLLNMKII